MNYSPRQIYHALLDELSYQGGGNSWIPRLFTQHAVRYSGGAEGYRGSYQGTGLFGLLALTQPQYDAGRPLAAAKGRTVSDGGIQTGTENLAAGFAYLRAYELKNGLQNVASNIAYPRLLKYLVLWHKWAWTTEFEDSYYFATLAQVEQTQFDTWFQMWKSGAKDVPIAVPTDPGTGTGTGTGNDPPRKDDGEINWVSVIGVVSGLGGILLAVLALNDRAEGKKK
jgi:hypothetical protein